jgi:replicative DNA helicase
MSQYIPENNYLQTNYTPIKGYHDDLCTRCENYYAHLLESGLTKVKFPPRCEKHIQNRILGLTEKDFSNEQEYQEAIILSDPISWAQGEFGWEARFYQNDMLSCTSKYKLYRCGRRLGKCLIKGTKVLTTNGPKNIEDLKKGDSVYDEHGNVIKVKELFDQGIQDVVDLSSNGKVVATSTLEHPWLTKHNTLESTKVRKVKDFYKGVKIVRTEVQAPLGNITEPHAYVLGVLSGDGCCREDGLVISGNEEKVIAKVASLLNTTYRNCKGNYSWYLPENNKSKINHYYKWLDNKYAHEKLANIDIIKTWDRISLLSYLAGVIDTDGGIRFTGKEITIRVDMQAKPVIEAVKYALLALWQIDANISIDNRPKYKNGPVYYISVKNIYLCKKALKELDQYIQVPKKKYKKEYDCLIPNNFDPTSIGVTISNPRKEHCYDIHVDSTTNLYLLANGLVTHNTEALVVETLHHVVTNKNNTVLVIAPYERQVTRFFDEINKFISKGTTIGGSLSRYTKTPSRMDFNNGSRILGFSAGATSASGSDKIRGQDAHLIIIDEIDTLEDKDIDAVMAILASHKECKLVAATTPRGWRRRFYTYCTDKNLGFKEFWFVSAESPEWDDKAEAFFKGTTDTTTYTHEYLADFAELEEGVFKGRYINASLQTYDITTIEPQPNCDYVLGVDWNKSAGTHMVIMEHYGSKLRMVKKVIIEESTYTQTDAVDLIISLNRKWRFKYIFVDAGYGSVQTELLRKHTLVEPSSMLDQKLYAIAMNQHLEVLDPLSGEPVKRNAKHFLIEQTRKLIEDGNIIVPKSEDTAVSASNVQMGVVQQMRNFRVEAVSVYGLPRYSQGQDHTLTAFYLACGGYYWKEGDLKSVPYVNHIIGLEVSDEVNQNIHPSVLERQEDLSSGWKLIKTTSKHQMPKSSKSRELGVDSLLRSKKFNNNRRGPNNSYRRGNF